jgi:hypothetical protein
LLNDFSFPWTADVISSISAFLELPRLDIVLEEPEGILSFKLDKNQVSIEKSTNGRQTVSKLEINVFGQNLENAQKKYFLGTFFSVYFKFYLKLAFL